MWLAVSADDDSLAKPKELKDTCNQLREPESATIDHRWPRNDLPVSSINTKDTNSTHGQSQMAKKKIEFRRVLKEWVLEKTGTALDKMNDVQRSHWMTMFYVNELVRKLEPTLLPDDDDDLLDCVVDGPLDNDADFIYRNGNDVVYILQIKYRRQGKPEDPKVFTSFATVLERLNPKYGEEYPKNDKLIRAVSDIDWDSDTFRLEFVSLGKSTPAIRTREEKGLKPIKGWAGIEDRVQLAFLDQSDLNTALRGATNVVEGITGTTPIRLSTDGNHSPWIPHVSPNGRKCYIGKIKAGELNQLQQDPRTRNNIFAMNIRNFVGDTATNKDIIKTALEEADSFFFYNNGISAVATKINADEDTKTLHCDGFSIINGAQTVRSIHKAFQKRSAEPKRLGAYDPSSAEVMIRVSEISYSGDDGDFVTNIIRYNNTQNAIKHSDFRSNDMVQKSLNDRFGKLMRGGKKFLYRNKRGSDRKGQRIAIGMEEFAKTVYAFWHGSHECFGGIKYLFDTAANGGYVKLFGDGGEVWTDLSKSDFEWLAGTWSVCEQVRERWKAQRDKLVRREEERANELLKDGRSTTRPIAKQALERRWMVFYAVGELLRTKFREEDIEPKSAIGRLSKPKWTEDGTSAEVTAIHEYTDEACELLTDCFQHRCENPNFTQRNWYRSRSTLEDISGKIGRKLSTISRLQNPTQL